MGGVPTEAIAPQRATPEEPPDPRKLPTAPLALAALGVVFGDIGTSPLYALQTVFSIEHNTVAVTPLDVYGVVSLMFWAVLIVVTGKYVLLVMRADNEGEGGILALVTLLQHHLRDRAGLVAKVTLIGVIGAALFYGDSVITPAISVMSALEGLDLVTPHAARWVLPAAILILAGLFAVQHFGTHRVGRAFGPIMLLWFGVLAVLGVPPILAHPQILAAVSPTYAFAFALQRPFIAFVAMGAVVLCITGAEALYADMGHFGRRPIRLAWLAIVLPALLLNYFGQGAMILSDPSTARNPFFHLAPDWARLPLVILAAMATVIASQAVIAGAFSVSRQAMRLGLLPRLTVIQTSKHEGGQIYLPAINWILFFAVLTLIAVFQSSARLASAYGLAVTGTLILTTTLFLFTARTLWSWSWWRIVAIGALAGGLELLFLAANLVKIHAGGWLPLLIGGAAITIMTTWQRGARIRTQRRAKLEGPLDDFVAAIHGLPRVPGIAVFPHPDRATTPLALRDNFEFNHVIHERIVIISIVNAPVPHVPHVERVQVDDLGDPGDGLVHVSYRIGFNDSQDIPRALTWAAGKSPETEFDPEKVRFFLSTARLKDTGRRLRPRWRRALFLWLARHEASRTVAFHLPPQHTIVMGAEIEL